jgi:hypothetical protein
MSTMILLGALLAFAPALWADRDDDKGGKPERKEVQKDHRKAPPKETGRAPVKPSPPVHTQPPRATPAPPVHRITPPPTDVRRPAPPPVKVPERKPPPTGYVLDKRHHHDHYYPPRGYVVPSLPPKRHVIHYHDRDYYYYHGIWYRPSGPRFVVVLPPIGIIVPILPPFYTTIWVGAIPYYYAGGVYYSWYPEYQSYVVVEPPPEKEIREAEAGSDQLFIYPKLGQSEAQQAKDRYECHSWAVSQTGFDPTQPGGGVSGEQYRDKRADYFRAMKACLEARNYSVQ